MRAAVVVAGALALLLGSASPMSRACGYDGMPLDLGLAHPVSLEMSLAIHQAYQGGLLAKPLPLAGGFAMRRALIALEKLRGRLPDATGSFSLLLVEPGLWTRFDAFEGAWQLILHTPPPTAGEPVAIVGEGALLAMTGGRLSARQALEAGLLRLDGDPRQVRRWQAAFAGQRTLATAAFVSKRLLHKTEVETACISLKRCTSPCRWSPNGPRPFTAAASAAIASPARASPAWPPACAAWA